MSPRRKTLFKYGRRGDQVRGKLDTRRNRIEVYYRDLEGVEHKRIFSNDKEGKAEAAAWAQTYHTTRAQMANEAKTPEKRAPLTQRELWEKFVASPAFTKDIRRATQINYLGRWKKWEVFMKPDSIVNETTLDDVDRFRAACDAAEIAINSVRQILNVVRTIYNWGQSRKLITNNELALFKWKTPKDALVLEPAEYSTEEYEKLLKQFDPTDHGQWRPWVALMILGHHGMRFRAVRHLRLSDVDYGAGVVRWPGEFQKQGKEVEQPITWAMHAALITAAIWAERELRPRETGRVRGAGGKWERDPDLSSEKISTPWILFSMGKGKQQPYSYSSFQYQLTQAEDRAGIEHQAYRAAHGFRRMVVGNLLLATGDLMTAMNYVGDIDLKQAKSYDRRMQQRIDKASASIEEGR